MICRKAEAYDFSLDEELNNKSDDVSDAALLKQLCFPYSTTGPQLSESELLRIDTMADHLEISRLKTMESYFLPMAMTTKVKHPKD